MRRGICCAGNMIVDITYPIETWPNQNELEVQQTTGVQLRDPDGVKPAPEVRKLYDLYGR